MPVRHTRRQKRSLCLSAYAHERRYACSAYASLARLCLGGHTSRIFGGCIVQEKGEILQAIVEESEEWV